MNNIEQRILDLKRELTDLESRLGSGFYAEESSGGEYYFERFHTCIMETDGEMAGMIFNEELVRKYLAQKDALK